MPVKDTSLATWLSPLHAANRRTLAERVYASLRDVGACTRKALAERLGKPINSITAPVKELLDARVIVEHNRVRDAETGALQWELKIKD